MIRLTPETRKDAVAGKTTVVWKKSGKDGHWLGCVSVRAGKAGKTDIFQVMWISLVSCKNPF